MAAMLELKKPKYSGKPALAHAASFKNSKAPGEDCVCFLCHDGGTLVVCDGRHCPKAYHPACVGRSVAFFNTKGAWFCARHFCSNCSKQPRTYCVMCPNSFCLKCLSCMPTEVYLPLSEEEGLCKTCIVLVKKIELQVTIAEEITGVNFESSGTVEFLFKEYWLLLKRFYGYDLSKCAVSCPGSPRPLDFSGNVKRDMPSTPTAIMQKTCTGSPTKEPISISKSLRCSVKACRTNNTGSILPAKRKIRVLKLLNDSSSEDDDVKKSSSSRIVNSNHRKASLISKPVSPEMITGAPLPFVQPNILDGKDSGARPFFVNNISTPPNFKALPKVIDDSSQQSFLVAPNLNSPSPLTDMPQSKIHPSPFSVADACQPPVNFSKFFTKPHRNEVLSITTLSRNNRVQSSHLACDGLASPKETSESALPKCQPALASTSCKPFATLPAAKMLPQPSNVSCKPSSIEPHSLKTSALDQHLQLPEDTSIDMLFSNSASPDSRRPSLRAKPLKRSHRSLAQESFNSVEASLSTCDKAETLAPITVQNVSRIYLRRSRLEELLSDQRFTLLIVDAFVRIRHSKHENNYRLVQITGTSTLQAHYYQVGEKKTNVVLEVLNLNKQQRIRIDHVSNSMFTEEECQRLQQSVELGFINAPTMKFLEEKAAALKRGKAINKCLDEKLAKFASKGASKELRLNKEVRLSWDKDGKTTLSADHLVKAQTQINMEKQVQAEQVPVCVESTTRIAERGSESFEANTETAVAENSGVEKPAALALCQPEKRQNQCPNCGINENLKRKIHVCLNEALTTAEKQVDADQHSDISVEMSTVFADTGQNKIHPPEIFSEIANQHFTEDDAELTPPKKVQKKGTEDEAESTPPMKAQKKGLQISGSNKYLMKEHWPSLRAETVTHTQVHAPAEACLEAQINGRKHMDATHHCDVGVDWATNIHGIVEDRMHEGKFSSSSAVNPGTKEVATSSFPQGIPPTESQEYGVINYLTDNDTGTPFQVENQGRTEEYMTTVLRNNDSGKRPVDVMQWFYQDMKERTFGPFSLKQLRKWSRTAVFPPNLKIWRTIAGQKSLILLDDALNAQGMEVILETENSFAVENCLNSPKQEGISFTESGSACHTLSKETSDDKGVSIARTDWLSPSVHAEQRLDSSLNLGNWSAPTEQMDLRSGALWTPPDSTQFVLEDVPIEISQDEHVVTNKEFENALNVQPEMIANTSAIETSIKREVKSRSDTKATVGKSNPTDTEAKETFAEGERGVQSKEAHLLEKEISAVKVTEGKCNPAYMEGKSSFACTEQDTVATSDNVCSLSEIGKPRVGTLSSILQSSQFEVLKEEAASVQTSQCESPCNFDVQVSNNRPEMAIQQGTETSVDAGMIFQSLEEETPDRKRESYSVKQRQEILKLNEEWNSPETCEFELETWATQYDALRKKEASINRDHDEILSKLIDAVTAEECKKSTPAQINCHASVEDTSVNGNIGCNSERTKKLATLDGGSASPIKLEQQTGWGLRNTSSNDGWGSPGKLEQENVWGSSSTTLHNGWGSPGKLDKRTGWGSPNASCFNQSEQKISMVQSCKDEMSSKKLQSKQVETENTQAVGLYDGIQKDNNDNLCRRARSLSHEMHLEKNQRGTESSQGNGRAQRIEDTDRKGSSRGQDTSLSKRSGGQRDFCYQKYTGGRASKFEDHRKETKSRHKRSHSRESIIRSKKDKSWRGERYFSDERKNAPKSTKRDVETASMRSHSRELHEQDRFKKDQKSLSKQLKVSAKFGYEKGEEDWTCHARNGWKVISKEQRACPENNGNRMEREVKKYYAKNDKESFSREQMSSPDSVRRSIEKNSKRSHDWRSFSKDRKASPENAANRKGERFYSTTDQRDISREKMVYHDAAGERRTHSGNDWEHAVRKHKTSPESRGNRASHTKPPPENARKLTEKEVRSFQARNNWRSLSKETMTSSRNAGRRNEEEDQETRSRDTLRSVPRDQSLLRYVDDPLKSRSFPREPRDFSALTVTSAHRSFSKNLNNDIHRGASKEGRSKWDKYTQEKNQGRQRGPSPCKELIQRSAHIFCPKEGTLEPTQTSDQGWTPPDSSLDRTARCWSPGIVGVGKCDDPFVFSNCSSKPEAHLSCTAHPGSPQHTWSGSYPELPPPPPVPVSTALSQMKPPPPPPLPAETSHICHINNYNV